MATREKKSKPELGFVEHFLLSGAAAVISKTTAAPIERVKLLLQNQGELLRQGKLNEPYKGIIDCFVRTLKHEGVLPFWRGNLANCMRYFPAQAFNFAFKDRIQTAFHKRPTDRKYVVFGKNIVAGGLAGMMSVTIVYSLDFARTRLANDTKHVRKCGGDREFSGIIDVYRKTIRAEGPLGLYRGFSISIVAIFVYRGLYFGLYDSLKPIVIGNDANLFASFCLGYGVTVSSGLVVYPMDTVRRRFMITAGQSSTKYRNPRECFVYIWQHEGAHAYMKGASANILRGIAGAGVLALFDKFKQAYVDWKSQGT